MANFTAEINVFISWNRNSFGLCSWFPRSCWLYRVELSNNSLTLSILRPKLKDEEGRCSYRCQQLLLSAQLATLVHPLIYIWSILASQTNQPKGDVTVTLSTVCYTVCGNSRFYFYSNGYKDTLSIVSWLAGACFVDLHSSSSFPMIPLSPTPPSSPLSQ